MSSASPSHLVSFPTSESVSSSPLPIPHLPFRRISLPTTPSPVLAAHRHSVASLASSDSLAEEAAVHLQRRVKRRSLNPATRTHRRTQADDDRETKRSKIISEFYATEKSYLDGLDLVYNHFLTPILRSLDTSKPLLTRNEITTLFSNFIDIWNFHHTFFAALSKRLHPSTPTPSNHNIPLSSLLLAHFPYLSLYAPFITAFPAALAFLTLLSQPSAANPAFAAFLRVQESHPVCAHLRLADYLLTPVQRCPRYLLLLKDLLNSTDPDDPEWGKLQEARGLVEKITHSLNTALAAHAQTLALVSLQRNTRDLPPVLTPLVAPGRRLIKRGALIQSGGEGQGAVRKLFDFLLLSDYLLWLEREETGIGALVHDGGGQSPRKRRASINTLGGNDEEKWWCRGYMSLVDMEVVMMVDRPGAVGSGAGGEERIEVLSPEGSFALCHESSSASSAGDPNSLTSWVDAIRTARAARLAALAMSNPDSTLSASTSGVHLRRALRAFASESDDVDDELKLEESRDRNEGHPQAGLSSAGTPRSRPRRAQLDSFLPAVWVPDSRTDTCMRCGRPFGFVLDLRLGDVFGWGFGKGNISGVEGKQKSETERDNNEGHQAGKKLGGGGAWRRKHHCRLCGRVVCSACSGKTFYVAQDDSDSSPAHKKQKPKTARACEECYEAAFPLIVPLMIGSEPFSPVSSATQPSSSSQTPSDRPSTPQANENPDALHDIQPWLSIPSRQAISKDVSEALMAMDLGPVVAALSRSSSRVALSASPSRVGLSNSPSRKTRLSTSPTKGSSPLRDSYTHAQGVPGSATSSPSGRIVHLPRISSGDSDPKPPSPVSAFHAEDASDGGVHPGARQEDHGYVPTRPIRVRPSPTRPRSYHDILEDFGMHERGLSIPSSISSAPGLGSVREGEDEAEGEDEIGIEIRRPNFDRSQEGFSVAGSFDGPSQEREGVARQEPVDEDVIPREDTARRRKRFSMPAVALQTAPVFARARQDSEVAERRRSALMHGGERDKSKKERQGEKEGSAIGLLMEVLRGKVKYPGRNS